MRKLEIDGVREIIEKTVTKDGKISGLKKYADQNVLIVVALGSDKK